MINVTDKGKNTGTFHSNILFVTANIY